MARAGSSSKFVSVNLNKSYGQPPLSGGGSSSLSSASGLNRSRLPNSHGGMVFLTRPSRTQPASSTASAPFKFSKLAVPRPVNLPSLRKEHAGNDPAVPPVGGSGSSGWTKQQVSALPVDGHPGSSVVDPAVGQGRSVPFTESSWGASVTQGRGASTNDAANQNLEGAPSSYQASTGRPLVYTPPGARSAGGNLSSILTPTPVEKAVVLRGEDFPSLQAARPSLAVLPPPRHKGLQQKQRGKQNELKDQQKKLQELSQHQLAHKAAEDVPLSHHHSGPQLQPAQPKRHQMRSKESSNHSQENGRSFDNHETLFERANRRSGKGGGPSYGPLQTTRWTHTSNWVDDERETLQTLRAEVMPQSDWVEPGNFQSTNYWARNHGANVGFGRPISRNGSLSGLGRDAEDSRDFSPVRNDGLGRSHGANVGFGRPVSRNGSVLSGLGRDIEDSREFSPVRNSGLSFESSHFKAVDFSNRHTNKEVYSDRLVLKPNEDLGKWDYFGRNEISKQRAVKDSNINNDGWFGNSSRSSGSNRDSFMYRDDGHKRERNFSTFRDSGNGRDVIYRGETFSWDKMGQHDYSRDAGLRKDSGFGKDYFVSKREAAGNTVDGSQGQHGDRVGRNNIFQFDRPAIYSHTNNNVDVRDRQDMFQLDYGRDKKPKFLYGQLQVSYPFLGDQLDRRETSVLGLEPYAGISGLEVKALRRKKDNSKDENFRDLARESFEADLERVQKMQEQERQRMVDEQKKAIELARKEHEERERLARAEEELRIKREEEAQEAAARAQSEVEEAVRRVEEERRAREEERQRILLEEERRKEAARRKLLELEERIAKRESGKRQEALQEEDGTLLVRPQVDKTHSQDDVRKVEELDWEDQERFLPGFVKAEQDNDELAPFSAALASNSPLAGREAAEGPSSQSRLVDPAPWSADMRGGCAERTKTMQDCLGEIHDNLPLAPAKSPLRDDVVPHKQHEQHQRGLSNREPSHEATRAPFSWKKRERVQSEISARSGHDQHWTSNEDMCFSARRFSVDVDSRSLDSTIEREADRWGGRGDRHRSQAQRRTSPPLQSYLHSVETSGHSPCGRVCQSLPKQPRVPPPPPGRAILPEKIVKSEHRDLVPHVLGDGDSGVGPKAREHGSEPVNLEVHDSEDVNDKNEQSSCLQVAKHPEFVALEGFSVQPVVGAQASVERAKVCQVQIHHKDLDETMLSDILSEKVDSGISDPIPPREGPEESVVHVTTDSQSGMAGVLIDDNEGLVVQKGEDGGDEELSVDDCVQVHAEGMPLEAKDQELVTPSKSIEEVEGDGDPASKYMAEDFEEFNEEEQIQQGRDEENATGKLEKSFDSQLEGAPESIQDICQGAEGKLKDQDLQRTMQEPVVRPVLLHPSYMSASPMEQVQFQQPEGLSCGHSFVQQFQQPFSFMAVPLPQSTPSNTVAAHPSVWASMHGLQNHQEIPFHLQLGVLSGTPLIPNAIQIGSIQMPLHMHPQVPQLAHLHGLQPPMFQFGQLGHSAPLTQSLQVVQPDVQAHPVVGEPLLSEHNQLKSDEPISDAGTLDSLPTTVQIFNAGDELLAQKAGFMWIEHDSALDRPSHSEHATSRSSVSSDCSFEQKYEVSKNSNVQALPPVEHNSEQSCSIGLTSREITADGTAEPNVQVDQTSVVWPSEIIFGGGKNYCPQSNGVLGQHQLRFHGRKKDDLESPHSSAEISLSEMRAEGSHNRRSYRNVFQSEYKGSDSFSSFHNESVVTTSQGMHQLGQELFQASDLDVSSGSASGEDGMNRDGHRESWTCMHSPALVEETVQTLNSRTSQGGAKYDCSYIQKMPLKNGLTNNLHPERGLKTYKSQSADAAALQSGVVCVFEQSGIEISNDEDDFIEVRSKKQMLREQREQREKESRAISKDIKEKEQDARKHQTFSAKGGQHNESAAKISSKNGMESQTVPSADTCHNEIRFSMHSLSAGTDITSSQSSVTTTSGQVFPPIGTPASVSSDGTVERISKASKSGQMRSTTGAIHNESGKLAGFARGSNSGSPDTVSNTTTAWGGQWSAQKVVSLTQIQLEEAMKPVCRFEKPLLQKVPMPETLNMGFEPQIPVAPIIVHEIAPVLARAPASVSASPISSLLAGEKIQFGAVTSPTLISPHNHPLSPALLVGVDSSLGSGSDLSHNYIYPGHTRHCSGSDRDVPFTSKGKHSRGDDGIHRPAVDPEAEAEAAASAVAVSAISSDESGGNVHCLDSRNAVLGGPAVVVAASGIENIDDFVGFPGVPITQPAIMQTLIKAPGIEDSMAAALPADLSVEMPSPLLQASLSSSPVSSGLMLQSFPSGASPFPCFEMGTVLGNPTFAFGPHEEALSFQQLPGPGMALEPALPAIGPGGVVGWHQSHAGTSDSFYGATPSGFTGPFISPTGGIPNVQGPPHMLVYTNPFAPVGQFGQLGVSIMGTTYVSSGKQPDWKHTPLITSCAGASGVSDVGITAGLSGTLLPQHSTTASNSAQLISPAGSSVIPIAAPLSPFDVKLSAPFQSQWSEVPPPHLQMPVPGSVVGLSLQPQHSSLAASQLGHFHHLKDVSRCFHQLPVPVPLASSSLSTVDAAAHFPDELGVGDLASSNASLINGVQLSPGRGHANSPAVPGTTGSSGLKSQRGRRPPRNSHGGGNGAPGSSGENFVLASITHGTDGSQVASAQLLTQNLREPGPLGQHPRSSGFTDQRSSQIGLARASLGTELSGSNHRKGGPVTVDRGSVGERGFVLPAKAKQVYVAKPAIVS